MKKIKNISNRGMVGSI